MSDSNQQKDSLGEGDIKLLYSVPIFIAWQMLVTGTVSDPLSAALGLSEVLARFIVGFVAFGGFIYWLWFSEKGPGLEGVNRALVWIFAPIIRIPEPIRFKALVPVFVVACLALITTIGWLISSDEASHKRALYNSWDRVSDIQWFYGDDDIDLYIYSETLDTIYGDRVPEDGDNPRAGVHIQYSSEFLQATETDLDDLLHHDIPQARVGDLEDVKGTSELGVYETRMTPYSFISYHGVFGITGHGVMEFSMMTLFLFVAIVFLVGNDKARSKHLLIFSVAFIVLSVAPLMMSNVEPTPSEIHLVEPKDL